MSVLEWKMLNFFKLKQFETNGKYEIIKNTDTYCSNSLYQIFCNANGAVHIYKDGECITVKISDNRINFCCIADEADIFVILEQDSLTNGIEVKLYNLSKLSKRIAPVIISTATMKSLCNVTTLKAFYAKTYLVLAFGLENGNILLYNSPLSRDISSSFKSINVSVKPIKGIEFLEIEKGIVKMFACSDAGVFSYTISNGANISHIVETKIVLDEMLASIHCWTLKCFDEAVEQYFVVGRNDALYCYTFEGRGPCYAIDGLKQIVKWFGKHLIVVLKSKKILKHGCHSSQLVIINVPNKMVVLNKELNNVVKCILPTADLNNCLIVLLDGVILTLQEFDLQYKLKLLYNKNLYDIALKLLEDFSTDLEVLSGAYIRYGDHLLQRGDISEAVQMYIKTIGIVSPFYIIKKLLITRHNEYMVQYLRALVKSNYNSPEHVLLLHNCYRRIELSSKVQQFFYLQETKYDYCHIDNSIAVKGYSEIKPFLEIFQDTQQIPNFFSAISDNEIIDFCSEYGFWLINRYPIEITGTIKFLFCERCQNFDSLQKLTRSFMLFLLLNKECSLGIIDKLHTLGGITTYLTGYNIWIDLVMHFWKTGDLDMNFVIKFLKTHVSQLYLDNVFIICRTHHFWPGIRMMYDRCSLEMLSLRCLVKCFEVSPSDMNEFVPNAKNRVSHQIWLQSLTNEMLDEYKSIKFVNTILGRMVYSNPHNILNALQCVLTNNNFHISHLNDLFLHESFLTKFKSHELENNVSFLDEQVFDLKKLLYDFMNKPIEFRSRSCDICKQSVKQPMVYFLCQHSYHKECIGLTSNGLLSCVSCDTIHISNYEGNFQECDEKYRNDQFVNKSCALQNVSNKLGRGIFIKTNSASKKIAAKIHSQAYLKSSEVLQKPYGNLNKINRDEISIKPTANPFEEANDELVINKYDTNLNPFEEK